MPKGIRKPKTQGSVLNQPSIQDRIRDAERQVAAGLKESVVVDPGTLERVLLLVISTGQTKAQILKKAVVLGLDVLTFKPDAEKKPNPFDVPWVEADAPKQIVGYSAIEEGYTLRRGPQRFHEPEPSEESESSDYLRTGLVTPEDQAF